MRRKDREVTDKEQILDILRRCDTLRIGIMGDEYPYVVPVSFGLDTAGEKPAVYFHCAREGLKLELLRNSPKVCVEGDIFLKTEPTDHGITTRYESVIGFGCCDFPEEEAEIIHGLQTITDHYGYYDYPLSSCRALQYLRVGRITLETLTGKRNLPAE